MLWLITLPFRLLSALLGTMLVVFIVVAIIGAVPIGGPLKKYEIDALGGAYSDALASVEGAARDMRRDYCAHADVDARQEAQCA